MYVGVSCVFGVVRLRLEAVGIDLGVSHYLEYFATSVAEINAIRKFWASWTVFQVYMMQCWKWSKKDKYNYLSQKNLLPRYKLS